MNRMFVGTAIVVSAFMPLVGCSYYTGKLEKPLHAKAIIAGPGITGEAHLYERYEGLVKIKLKLEGTAESKLKPGRHAIHIHEVGTMTETWMRQSIRRRTSHPDWGTIPTISAISRTSP